MKLQDAIREMNPGDIFRNMKMDQEGILRFIKSGVYVSVCTYNLDLEGEIVVENPHAEDADEWVERYAGPDYHSRTYDYSDMCEAFEEGRESLQPNNADQYLCPQCEKPRGKLKLGGYVSPCPHCGDHCPF